MRVPRTARFASLFAAAFAFLCLLAHPARATAPPRSGTVPDEVARAATEGLFALPERSRGLTTSASTSQETWCVPVILASFSDSALTYDPDDFNRALFDTTRSSPTGSIQDYYRWVSGGRLNLTFRIVAVVQLQNSRAYYANNSWGFNPLGTPQNAYGFVRDAIRATPVSVDWSDFDLDHDGYVDMLWVVHAGLGGEASSDRNNLWSFTGRMSSGWRSGVPYVTDDPIPGTSSQYIRIDRFTTLPELSAFHRTSISEIGVYCHEFGHALGLPDLYDTTNLSGVQNTGPGNWALMSSGAYGTDGISPQYPSHLGAWSLEFLGWDKTFRPESDTTISLAPIENGGQVLDWWFQGESSPEHFLIENRQRLGFDRNLLGEGLIVCHVDETVIGERLRTNDINRGPIPGMWLVEASGDSDLYLGRNRSDAGDPFPGSLNRTVLDDDTRPNSRTFANTVTQIALSEIAPLGDSMRVRVRVRAPGWGTAEDRSRGEYRPVESNPFAPVAGVDARAVEHVVTSEEREGVPQIVLREGGMDWSVPLQVSHSTRAALTPTLAVLPAGDVVTVWSDFRKGRAQLFYRMRSGSAWSSETQITDLPGDCLNPSVAIDARGMVSLAFQDVVAGVPQIFFMRFPCSAPVARPVAITAPGAEVPNRPALVLLPSGAAMVMWADAAVQPQRFVFARVHPDSGISSRLPLCPWSSLAQVGMSAAVDGAGTLHIAWQLAGPGTSELHYQQRPGMPDTLLENSASTLQNPRLAVDAQNSVHLVYEQSRGTVLQARYRSWRQSRGWEARSTELTPASYSVAGPLPLPSMLGNLAVAYTAYLDDGAHFMVLDRVLQSPTPIASPVPREPAVIPARRFAVGPSPLRAGTPLQISETGASRASAPRVDFFDLAGRRIAAVELGRVGDQWRASIAAETTRGWSSGVYFARQRDDPTAIVRLVVLH